MVARNTRAKRKKKAGKASAARAKNKATGKWRRWFRWCVLAVVAGLGLIIGLNLWVIMATRTRVHDSLETLPANRVALVLGTSSRYRDGSPNLFFKHRMEAAAYLFHQGKVRYLLVSGDNRQKTYNEPLEMQKTLVALGVPEQHIVLDYAGLRTLDSITRAQQIFGQNQLTIISQENHNYRALFIARHLGMDAVAYSAQSAPLRNAFRVALREYLARVKAVLDLYILQTEPRFLGDPIAIPPKLEASP